MCGVLRAGNASNMTLGSGLPVYQVTYLNPEKNKSSVPGCLIMISLYKVGLSEVKLGPARWGSATTHKNPMQASQKILSNQS